MRKEQIPLWKAGRPWVDSLHARRDAVLAERQRRRRARKALPAAAQTQSVAAFFEGRDVLVTGGIGFLGRCLIEELLHSCPGIGTLFVVVRSKRGVEPQERLRAALDVPLFDRVLAEQPNALSKIVAVSGDMAEAGLGLSDEDRRLLQETVSVVFHTAATVRFNDPLKKAVLTNTRSTRDIVDLARKMPKLKVLLHVSTAFAFTKEDVLQERVYSVPIDWRMVLRVAENVEDVGLVDHLGPKLLRDQPNTYTFSKALAEQIVNEASQEIPTVIVRPSIVTGTWRDPMPGWVDNLYGFSAFWVLAFKGVMRVYQTPEVDFPNNLVPADMVIKSMILAAWAKGTGQPLSSNPREGESPVINTIVDPAMETRMEDMYTTLHTLPSIVPFPQAVRYPKLILGTNAYLGAVQRFWYHIVFGFIIDCLAMATGQKPRLVSIYRKMTWALNETAYFTQRRVSFEGDNQWHLQTLVHRDEEKSLCMVESLNGKNSEEEFKQVLVKTVRGILKYCLKETDDVEKNGAAYRKLWWIETIVNTILCALVIIMLYAFCSRF